MLSFSWASRTPPELTSISIPSAHKTHNTRFEKRSRLTRQCQDAGKLNIDVIGKGGFGIEKGSVVQLGVHVWNVQEKVERSIARRRSGSTILGMEDTMPSKRSVLLRNWTR